METVTCISLKALPKASRQLRKTFKMSVREAAKAAKISHSTFSRIECGGGCDAKTYIRMSAWVLARGGGVTAP